MVNHAEQADGHNKAGFLIFGTKNDKTGFSQKYTIHRIILF